MDGCPLVFLLEVVSSPQRDEKRLRRLLKVRGMAWFRLLMVLSVRADTCDQAHKISLKGFFSCNYITDDNLPIFMAYIEICMEKEKVERWDKRRNLLIIAAFD